MKTARSLILFLLLLAAASGYAISVLGPFVLLDVLDESQFPAASVATGGLLFGSDAGTVYVSDGVTWNLVASGSESFYGEDLPVRRCALAPFSGSTPHDQGLQEVASNNTGVALGAGTRATTSVLDQWQRLRWTTTSTANTVLGGRFGQSSGANSGARVGVVSGVGGYFFWARWFSTPGGATSSFYAGLRMTTDGGVEPEDGGTQFCRPSTGWNTLYMGCDTTEDTMSICSNDASGTATCTSLGAGFPCDTGTQFSDVIFNVAPGGGSATYYVKDLFTNNVTQGTISTNLPDPTQGMLADLRGCNGSDGGVTTLGFVSVCLGME